MKNSHFTSQKFHSQNLKSTIQISLFILTNFCCLKFPRRINIYELQTIYHLMLIQPSLTSAVKSIKSLNSGYLRSYLTRKWKEKVFNFFDLGDKVGRTISTRGHGLGRWTHRFRVHTVKSDNYPQGKIAHYKTLSPIHTCNLGNTSNSIST